jgi:hypothetical protein
MKIRLNGVDYDVANVSSVASLTLTSAYAGTTGTVSFTLYPYVLLRLYALQSFTANPSNEIIQASTPGSGNFYKQYGCSVISNTLYIPEISVESTYDAGNPGEQSARWFAGFYLPTGALIGAYQRFDQFTLANTPTTQTWAQILAYNNPGTPPPPNFDTYTKIQINQIFAGSGGGGSGTVTSVTAGTGLTGGTITHSGTIGLASSGVSANTYSLATVTVDATGRITSASNAADTILGGSCTNCDLHYNSKGQLTLATNGSGGSGGGVTSITAGAGLSGGTITTTGTISLPSVTSAGSCTSCDLTVDDQGRITVKSDGAGGGFGSPTGAWVLKLNGFGESVLVDNNWFYNDVQLPGCTYEAWINVDPAYTSSGGYIFADGGGGAHAVLFGVGNEATGARLTGNICGPLCNGSDSVSYTGNYVFPKGEWHHVAWSWNGTAMETFVDGVPDGYTLFSGPRATPGIVGGGGPLYIGGSDHSNFMGKIAGARVWEGAPVYSAAIFNPSLSLGYDSGVNTYHPGAVPSLVYDMSTPGTILPDLSGGYRGQLHPGKVVNSNYANSNANPIRATWVYDGAAPTATDSWTPPVGNLPIQPAIPSGAKIFDSFSHPNNTFLNAGCCGPLTAITGTCDVVNGSASVTGVTNITPAYVGTRAVPIINGVTYVAMVTSTTTMTLTTPYAGTTGNTTFYFANQWPLMFDTEAGASLGAKAWEYDGAYVYGAIGQWGYFNGELINKNTYGNAIIFNTALIDTTVSDGTFCIDREAPQFASVAGSTSLFFRYADASNNWWLFAPGVSSGTSRDEVRTWRTVSGTPVLVNTTAGSSNWVTLCAVTAGNNITIKTDGNTIYTTTDANMNTATKAGIGGAIEAHVFLLGQAKWDNFLVK